MEIMEGVMSVLSMEKCKLVGGHTSEGNGNFYVLNKNLLYLSYKV